MYNTTIQHEIAQEALKKLDINRVLPLWNEYCEENCYEMIEYYDEETINWLLRDMEPMDIIRMAKNGTFKADAEYFTFNGYGNIKTMTAKEVLEEIDYYQLADMIVYNLLYYKNNIPEIAEAFKEYEEENNDSKEELYT